MSSQTSQITSVQPAQTGGVISCPKTSADGPLSRPSLFSQEKDAGRMPALPTGELRECSICDQAKLAKGFRKVIGRITTEACGDCCDLRDEVSKVDPLGPTAIAEFCLRVATKRFRRLEFRLQTASGRLKSELRTKVTAPQPTNKEKSALAKDPKEYAAWLQKFPDRVAAIVAKTYAVKGDEAFKHGVPDDVALVQIMDLLNEGDDTLIPRNANKRLTRSRRPS